MPTTFLALQCYNCSTMQVKQHKKSSNNWTCVVCNQTQSVRNVFARGFVAKNLRLFVQNFNMGRKVADENNAVLVGMEGGSVDDGVGEERVGKRRDWSEYLDNNEGAEDGNRVEEGDKSEGNFVTELPNDAFKRPKLKNYSNSAAGDCGKLLKPVFAWRKVNKLGIAREKRPDKSEWNSYMKDNGKEFWNDSAAMDIKETKICLPVTGKKTCKWDSYIAEDDENVGLDNQRGTKSLDNMGQSSSDVYNSLPDDQRVEEDVHPDFM